jgi:glycosyltransferase involved in cell wall biosynthesis
MMKLLLRRPSLTPAAPPAPTMPAPSAADIAARRARVDLCYRAILSRTADDDGLRTYCAKLDRGAPTAEIVLDLLTSDECRAMNRASEALAAGVLRVALADGAHGAAWGPILTGLAQRDTLGADALRSEFTDPAAGERRAIGRVRIEPDGAVTGWAVSTAEPGLPLEVVLEAGADRLTARTAVGPDGIGFRAPDGFAVLDLERLTASAEGEPLCIAHGDDPLGMRVAALLEPQREWLATLVADADPTAGLAPESPALDGHEAGAPDCAPDHLRHALARHRSGRWETLGDAERLDAVQWYVNDFREHWPATGPFPMSARFVRHLQEAAFTDDVAPGHVSRLMLLFWKRHFDDKRMLFDREGQRHLVYRLVSSPNGGMASFLRACGDRVLAPLRQRHPASSRLPLGINWYWHIGLSEEHGLDDLGRMEPLRYLAISFCKLLEAVATGRHVTLLPPEWIRFWCADLGDGSGRGERLLARALLGGASEDDRAIAWLDGVLYHAHPALRVLSPRHLPGVTERDFADALLRAATPGAGTPALVVLGHTGTSGLGANLRMSVDTLRHAGIEPAIASVDEPRLRIRAERLATPTPLARPVVLFNVNADRVPDELARLPLALQRDAYRIGFFLWETSVTPATHRLGLDLMDEIWAPTEYVASVLRAATRTPVHVVRKGLRPPTAVTPMRRDALGLSDDDFVFLAIGDFHSSIPRKHPLAAVRAFLDAFPDRQDVKLLLKVRNVDHAHWSNRGGYWQALERTVGDDPRIGVLEGELTDAEYWGLLDAVDAFVSLHRSEGFGYGIAHAMMRGRPVVVSDYSGSRDFCTDTTALRVPVTEVPVGALEMPDVCEGARWAEPDPRHAAAALRALVEDRDAARTRAVAARALITDAYSIGTFAGTLLERLAATGALAARRSG